MGQFFNPQDLGAIAPELELMLFGMILMIADLLVENKKWLGLISLGGIGWSGFFLYRLHRALENTSGFYAYGGLLTIDHLAWLFKLIFLIGAALTVLISMKYLDIEREQHGEYYALIMFATMGMMFMAGAMDLITLYISLETMAIATYVLVGFLRSNQRSNEASLKYFLLGAFSSGILLYGMSLLYGISGSTRFSDIAEALNVRLEQNSNDPIAMMALIAVLTGLFFKIAAVPFHQWTPDAYEGAPSPITGYMSVAVKAASFVMLVRVLFFALLPLHEQWTTILSAVAVLTMTVGNVAAMTQTNVKRLLAYSSISHAGYILLGVIAAYKSPETGMTAIQIYMLVYTFTNIGIWALVVAMRSRDLIGEQISEMNGLGYKHPTLAILMLIFLLSLAGIPPTAGFIAKYYIFSGLIQTQHSTLAVIAVLNAAVSVFYYLRIVAAMFMKESSDKTKLSLSPGILITMSVALVFTLWIGFYPDPFINLARELFPKL